MKTHSNLGSKHKKKASHGPRRHIVRKKKTKPSWILALARKARETEEPTSDSNSLQAKRNFSDLLEGSNCSSSGDSENEQTSLRKLVSHKERVKLMRNKFPAENGVFLRQLPTDLSEEDIREFMKAYGEVRRVFVVLDSRTQISRGSAFVYFCKAEEAQEVLACATRNKTSSEASELQGESQSEKTKWKSHRIEKKEIFGRAQLGQNAPDHIQKPFLIFGERRVECLPVEAKNKMKTQTSEKVGETTTTQKTKATTQDNRNLYLLGEGYITASDSSAVGVSPSDIRQREQLIAIRMKKLKNLSYHVSRTRLCVHNIPLNESQENLCDLFSKYGTPTDVRLMMEHADSEISKGFAFVEFATHEEALKTLRELNNNPHIWGSKRRPIVEFSLQSVQVLKKLEARKSEKLAKSTQKNHKGGKRKTRFYVKNRD